MSREYSLQRSPHFLDLFNFIVNIQVYQLMVMVNVIVILAYV